MLISANRWRHFVAMALIGDGVMAVVHPRRDAAAWNAGPQWWKCFMQYLHDRPALTRAVGAAQVAGGIWWALSAEDGQGHNRPNVNG